MSESAVEKTLLEQKAAEPTTKLYKRRWIILFIFVLYAAISSAQWIEYPIISHNVEKFYGVSASLVEWTSIIYMAVYAPLVIPASYIVNKMGLRAAGLYGGLGTAIGSIIKIFSAQQDMYWLVLLGQFFLAISQTVIIGLPPRLAAVWFGAEEISTASALGVFGTQLGTGVGFILPPLIVQNSDNFEVLGNSFYILCWYFAGVMIPVAIAIIVYFPKQPPKPPSVTQIMERSYEGKFDNRQFFRSFKLLLTDKGFLIHMVSYGINVASFSAVATLLNKYVLEYFPDSEKDAGLMGLALVVAGTIGSVLFGVFLDKTHKFKESCVFIYVMCVVGVTALTAALHFKMKLCVYISCAIVGLFTNAYWSVGFEMSTELTYPASEMTTTGVLLSSSQILGVLITIIAGWLFQNYKTFWSLMSQIILLLIGTISTILTPNTLKRQAVFKANKKETQKGVFKEIPTKI